MGGAFGVDELWRPFKALRFEGLVVAVARSGPILRGNSEVVPGLGGEAVDPFVDPLCSIAADRFFEGGPGERKPVCLRRPSWKYQFVSSPRG
jgi:hypothetical protein